MAVRPRDELGWRVPRPGTTSAVIYALARQGLSTGEIAKELGRGYQTVAVLVFKIKHPERGNQLGNARREKRPNAPYERKPITADETHARKVARVLHLPLDQARALVRGERFRTAASAEPEPSAVASIVGGERPTTIIVSTPQEQRLPALSIEHRQGGQKRPGSGQLQRR